MIGAAELQGHWRRAWIRAPGHEDATTRVHWLQAGALFADLRVPADRPDLSGAACLADLSPGALADLMRAEGFAGTISVGQGVCTWHREINWHGRSDAVDAGRLSFDAAGDLIEDGVHADYRELWRREPGDPLAAARIAAGGLAGVLVASETEFLLALGDPAAPPSGPLAAALSEGRYPTGLARHFASVYVLGRWQGPLGVATLSTNPFEEGAPLLERTAAGLVLKGHDFHGKRSPVALTLDTAALHPA